MKTKVRLSVIIALLCSALSGINLMAAGEESKVPGSLTVTATADLYNITSTWAAEYQKQHPGQIVNVIRFNKQAKPEVFAPCFITDEDNAMLSDDNLWRMVVGREVIVPVISSGNPALTNLQQHGISQSVLAGLLKKSEGGQKQELEGASVHCYILDDGSLKLQLAKFLKTDGSAFNATLISTGEELSAILAKDPNALGICRLSDVLDMNKHELLPGLSLLPVDKNGNGKLEGYENIYANLKDFMHGVWIGKYPGVLTTNIYAVAPAKPENESEIAFMKWIVEDGQQYLNQNGFFELGYNERETRKAVLEPAITLTAVQKGSSPLQTIMLVLLAVVLAGSILFWIVGSHRNKKLAPGKSHHKASPFDISGINAPKGLWFDKSHTWAFMEQNGMVRVGIDDFLQHITGPLSRVQMKNPGEKVMKGEKIFTIIQNGKHLDICSPVSGTIRTQNGMLNSRSSLLNSAPYSDGWVYTIEPTNWLRDTEFLFMAEKYTTWVKQEFTRLKEFFATSLVSQQIHQMPVVLQDGGEMEDHVLASFGPEVWEEFQMRFIDATK
jgi:glycine cleavage system H lipoate-binding protein/ABC-type phosphate transport system substrate-binding protein